MEPELTPDDYAATYSVEDKAAYQPEPCVQCEHRWFHLRWMPVHFGEEKRYLLIEQSCVQCSGYQSAMRKLQDADVRRTDARLSEQEARAVLNAITGAQIREAKQAMGLADTTKFNPGGFIPRVTGSSRTRGHMDHVHMPLNGSNTGNQSIVRQARR